jgi:hypothetical protein
MSTEKAPAWRTKFIGGDSQTEAAFVKNAVKEIQFVQADNQARSKAPAIQRAFHAKSHAGLTDARFVVAADVPPGFQVGPFQPGKEYAATLRFSSASGIPQPDQMRDARGLAVRLCLDDGRVQDFLATSAPASHVRDAREFIAFARAMAAPWKLFAPFRLALRVGPFAAIAIIWRALGQLKHSQSVALESYWSRGAYRFGSTPARFLLRPAPGSPAAKEYPGPDFLRTEFAERRRGGEVRFEFCVQPFVNETITPIENAAAAWPESTSRPVKLAELVIPQRDTAGEESAGIEDVVNSMEFNPWHTTEIEPLGAINRARKQVYDASADHRHGRRFAPVRSGLNWFVNLFTRPIFWFVNRVLRIEWWQMLSDLGAMNLLVLRNQLRRYNLYDTRALETSPVPRPVPRHVPAEVRSIRTPDGSFNDLSDPDMGKTGMPFGRMWPLEYKWPAPERLLEPNPRLVSERLLARDHFRPATSLNLLAAAWIQFQVHGWIDHRRFDHAKFDPKDSNRTIHVAIPPGDPWPSGPLNVPRTIVEPMAVPKGRAYANELSPWWSLSQVYGRSPQATLDLRTMADGKLQVDVATGRLLEDKDVRGIDHTGFNNNYWVGLSLLHTIFTLEHNAICDMLRATYPNWNDEQLFQKARLINAALNAKIHTVEWTPAILFHPTIKLGLEGNWWGAVRHGKLAEFAAGLVDVEARTGIPGSIPNHHNATYSLPEEFVTVYKMHPLIPDEIELFAHRDGAKLGGVPFPEANGKFVRGVIDKYGMLDVWYSFGVTHPGAITLQNYPKSLREFKTIEGQNGAPGFVFDLATHDIIRERERGIPRYNDFRELLHRRRLNSIDELTPDPEWRKRLKEVYGDDINNVDTMVGLFAEPLPSGFGFSDTAFRVFILTASRRLKSDRFFTVDYTPQVYTAEGLDWIEKNDMRTMILRHYPELATALTRTKNTFHPWVAANG